MNPQSTIPTPTLQAPSAPPIQSPTDAASSYATLKAAVLGAQGNTAPGTSPLGSFPELNQIYGLGNQADQAKFAGAAPQYNTGVTVANDQANAAAAASVAQQKLTALADATKYQQVQKPDGGYAFYDPLGNQISASDYAGITNKSLADVLKNSQNPIDKAFTQDYKQLENYINDKQNSKSDPQAAANAAAVEAEVKKAYGINLAKESPQQVIQSFQQAYPTVFGGNKAGPQGTNTLLPDANYVKTNAVSGAGNNTI